MKMEPLYDKIIIKRDEATGPKVSKIYIPEMFKEKAESGTVVAVGHGRITFSGTVLPLRVQPGDRVLFGKFNGTDFKVGEEEFVSIREEDVHCVVRD